MSSALSSSQFFRNVQCFFRFFHKQYNHFPFSAGMVKIAIIGPDNVGKSAIADYLSGKYAVELIESTSFRHSSSRAIRLAGRAMKALTGLGDRFYSWYLSGIGYFGDLMLINAANKAAGEQAVYVRHPGADFDIYSAEYLGNGLLRKIGDRILRPLAGNMDNIDLVIYLQADAQTLIARSNGSKQMHEDAGSVDRIVKAYDALAIGMKGQRQMVMVDTALLSLEQVIVGIDSVMEEKQVHKK